MLVTEAKNISYHRGNGLPLFDLCEIEYHNKILTHLKQIIGQDFQKTHFHLLTHNGHEQLDFPFDQLSGDKPNVLFYFSDETGSIPYELMAHFDLIFKAYFPYDQYNNVFPLPTGVNKKIPLPEITHINERPLDLFFAGNLNHNRILFWEYFQGNFGSQFINQQEYFEHLRSQLPITQTHNHHSQKSFIQFNKGFNQGLNGPDYAEKLAQSKIALCPEGYFSNETYRHYEAMRAGCILISKPLSDVYYWREAPIIQVNDWQELDDIIPDLLHEPATMEQLQAQTLDWWNRVLEPGALAGHINKPINKLFSQGNMQNN